MSKRWRAAALRSVKMLGSSKAADGLRRHFLTTDFERLPALFPYLTALTIAVTRDGIRDVTLPTSLRILTLDLEEDALGNIDGFLPPYPPLTHLSLVGEDFYPGPIFERFISGISSSLTRLRLDERCIAGGAKEFVASQRFPLLSSLRLAVGLDGAADLVWRHCDGLTRLALTEHISTDLFSLSGANMPKLRSLKVATLAERDALVAIVTAAPSLTSLSLISYPHVHDLPSACFSLVTKLETSLPANLLPQGDLTRLRQLIVKPVMTVHRPPPLDTPLDGLSPALLSHLRVACIGRVPPKGLRFARQLRELRLQHLWPFEEPIHFPDLRSLHLASEEMDFQQQIVSARRFVRSCPLLREITGFDLKYRALSRQEAIAFERLLQEAAERGVERIAITRLAAAARDIAARFTDAGWLVVASVPHLPAMVDPRYSYVPYIK